MTTCKKLFRREASALGQNGHSQRKTSRPLQPESGLLTDRHAMNATIYRTTIKDVSGRIYVLFVQE